MSAYAAVSARRSAQAAERSAQAAEATLGLEHARERERWIEAFAAALPDGEHVTGLLGDLPKEFRGEWELLLTSAAQRNLRTPPRKLEELRAQCGATWRAAAERTRESERA